MRLAQPHTSNFTFPPLQQQQQYSQPYVHQYRPQASGFNQSYQAPAFGSQGSQGFYTLGSRASIGRPSQGRGKNREKTSAQNYAVNVTKTQDTTAKGTIDGMILIPNL